MARLGIAKDFLTEFSKLEKSVQISVMIRDDAWARMIPEHRDAHIRLWTDLTRRARPGYVAAPASLLAFVAWQVGDGVLGNLAIDRAPADDPGYSVALLIRDALTSPSQEARERQCTPSSSRPMSVSRC